MDLNELILTDLTDNERKLWDRFINGYFGLSELNYIKPFRHLIHLILHNISVLRADVDALGGSDLPERVDALEKALSELEEKVSALENDKADKDDLEALTARVETLEECCKEVQSAIDDLKNADEDLLERVLKNASDIADLEETKADKADIEDFEKTTDERLDNLEECCESVETQIDAINDTLDEHSEDIADLKEHEVYLSGKNGTIATDDFIDANFLEMNMTDILAAMYEKKVMKYEIYTMYNAENDNFIKEIHDGALSVYGYEWDNYGFIEIDNIYYATTQPRTKVVLIPRERDVYICLDFVLDEWHGHCFLHRTELKPLEDRISELETSVEDINAADIARDEKINDLFNDLEALEKVTAQNSEDILLNTSNINDIYSIIETLRNADTDMETKIADLENGYTDIRVTIAEMKGDITAANEKAESAKDVASSALDIANHALADISTIAAKVENVTGRVEILEECCETVQETLADLDTRVSDAETKANEASEKVNDISETVSKNSEDIAELQSCCETVQETLTDLDTKVSDAESKANEASEKVDDLSETVSKNSEDIAELQSCCETVQETLTDLDTKVSDAESKANEASEKVDDLSETVSKNSEDIAELQSCCETVQKKIYKEVGFGNITEYVRDNAPYLVYYQILNDVVFLDFYFYASETNPNESTRYYLTDLPPAGYEGSSITFSGFVSHDNIATGDVLTTISFSLRNTSTIRTAEISTCFAFSDYDNELVHGHVVYPKNSGDA